MFKHVSLWAKVNVNTGRHTEPANKKPVLFCVKSLHRGDFTQNNLGAFNPDLVSAHY